MISTATDPPAVCGRFAPHLLLISAPGASGAHGTEATKPRSQPILLEAMDDLRPRWPGTAFSSLLDDLPVGYPEQLRVGDRYAELALGLSQDDDALVGGAATEVRRAAPNGRSRHPARIRENADQVQPVNASATDTLPSTAGIGCAHDRASWTVWSLAGQRQPRARPWSGL
jgi:hypothetical protein